MFKRMLLACCLGMMAPAWALQLSTGLPSAGTVSRGSKAPAPIKPELPGTAIETNTLTLAQLYGTGGTTELHGRDASMTVYLPLSAKRELLSVQLNLQGNVSLALVAPSQLVVTVNNEVVEQFRLHGDHTKLQADITLPASAFRNGYNAVRVQVGQHYREVCEEYFGPELWTRLDLQKSHFTLTSRARMKQPLLDGLDQVFDKTTWVQRPELHVLSAGKTSDGQLQAMAALAQGVSLRYEYVPIKVYAGRYQGVWPGSGQVVLVGTRAELKPWLLDLNVPQNDKPVMAIRPLPGDSSRALLLLAANDDADLQRLAQAFAMRELPLPNLSWVSLDKLTVPQLAKLPPALAVQAASQPVVPFQYMDYKTTTFLGIDSPTKAMNFWNDRWQGRLHIRLHLAYAAGMSTQSALNLMVNGVMVGSIPLNDEKGGQFDDYTVSVPTTALMPGWNKLEIAPVLIPLSHGGKCMPFFPGNLAVTVFDDSTVERLGGSTLHEPNLGLLAYTGQVELAHVSERLTVQMLDGEDDTLSAALTLLAKMSQVQKRPLWQVKLATGPIAADAGPSIVLGKRSLLPSAARSEIEARTNYTIDMPIENQALGNSWYALFPPVVRDFFAMNPPAQRHSQAEVVISADLSRQLFALALSRNAGAWTIFSAETPAVLARGMDTLTGSGHWGQLNGRLAFLDPDDEAVHSVPVDTIPTSAFGLRGGLGMFASQHPWLALLAVLATLALFVWLTPRLLRFYKIRRHPAE